MGDSPPLVEPPVRNAASPWRRKAHAWARWLHVYTSMIALLIVLFFGITGITLNHPSWTFGDATTRQTVDGSFEFPVEADGAVDWLTIAEYIRSEYDVKGAVASFDVVNGEGSIIFKNPGYSADLVFDVETAAYELTVEQQGFLAVMNDLHKGRDANSTWKWVIDISAGFLVVISLTGLTMQFFLRKRRRSALIGATVGGVVSIVLMYLTLR
jgi:hypothetical protein